MGAPAARAAELARHWAKAGHQVTVLTGFPNHPTGVVAAEYRSRFRRLVCRETIDEAQVVRTWLMPLPNRKPWERMLNYTSFCVSCSVAGLFLQPPDVVIGSSPQLLVAVAAWWIARRYRVPFVFEVRDLWPESLVAVGMSSKRSTLHHTLQKIAAFLYRKADHIVVVSPAFQDCLIQNWGVAAEKISVVENGVESEVFAPQANRESLRRQLKLQDKFVAAYVGTLGMAQGLEVLVEVARRLSDLHPKIMLLLVGEGADSRRIKDLLRVRNLTNVRIMGQQPRELIPAYICASDVCLVPLKKTELFKTVIPSKMLEFMACGRPVIVGVDGQARQIVEDAHAGIYVEPEDECELASAIVRLAGDEELGKELGRNGRRYVLKHFSRAQKAESYIGVLDRLLASSGPRRLFELEPVS